MTHSNNSNPVPYGPKQLPWNKQVPEWADVTSPLQNPIDSYDQVPPKKLKETDYPPINYAKFEIPPEGLTAEEYDDAMQEFKCFVETQHKRFTGYQTNEYLDKNDDLSWLLNIHTNNVGDPFTTGIFTLNTKFIERAVLDYFAALWRAHWPYNPNDHGECYWGYVMSMGSTEGNIYALYNAREYLSGGKIILDEEKDKKVNDKMKRGKFALDKSYKHIRPLVNTDDKNKYKPIVFYSEDTHYSVIKAVSLCAFTNFYEEGMRQYKYECPLDGYTDSWPEEVPSHNLNHDDPLSGTIRLEDLELLVNFFVEKGHPIMIILNQGSTWKGAYDNVPAVDTLLKRLGEKHPWLWDRPVEYMINGETHTDRRRGFWLHIDGALGSAYLPFLRMAKNKGMLHQPVPEFDFSIASVMSIVCSMHKWIGGPWPGGIYMTKRKYQLSPPDTAGYIGSPDTTLGGSRNGFSPLLFWKYFAKNNYEENIKRVLATEREAERFEKEMKKLEAELQGRFPDENVDLWIHRSQLSLAVLFRKVNADISYKYTVDSERITVPFYEGESLFKESRSYSHIYSMTSLEKYGLTDKLINDIRSACVNHWKDAFPERWTEEEGKVIYNPGNKISVA